MIPKTARLRKRGTVAYEGHEGIYNRYLGPWRHVASPAWLPRLNDNSLNPIPEPESLKAQGLKPEPYALKPEPTTH